MDDQASPQRVSLADCASRPELAGLFDAIASQRNGSVPNLYRALAISPDICAAWLALFTLLRQQSVVPVLLREFAMLRIAMLNRAEYEFVAHRPYAVRAGATEAQLVNLMQVEIDQSLFDGPARAVLSYVEAMTKRVQVDEPIFDALREFFDEKARLELTVIIAGYNMVSRVLEALRIPHDT
jgi:alkylhydroperoxidase family enzyme